MNHPFSARRAMSVGLALGLLATGAYCQRWSDPATWGGRVPQAGDVVTIPAGKTVVLDGATAALGGLKINGVLTAATNADVAITSNYIVTMGGGRLQIGTAVAPFLRRATLTLTGNTVAEPPTLKGLGNKVLGTMGGTLSLHGAPVVRSWTKLNADVTPGTRRLILAEAPGWRAGDQVVVATSSLNQNEYSLGEIESIQGNVVTLRSGLRYGHLGSVRQSGGLSFDVRTEVGLLSRNIVVQGDASSLTTKIGGHAMFMNGMCPESGGMNCQCEGPRMATVQLQNVEFRRMGQLNQTGRYPIHFHQMGATQNCYVRDVTVRDTIQRGIVLHDVSGVRVEGNVIFSVVGHNLVVETEITRGNRIAGNLALVNRQAVPLQTSQTFLDQNDRLPSNYWLKSGANEVVGNVAAGSFNSGFIFDGINSDPIHFLNNVAHGAMGLEGAGAGDFDLSAGILIVSGEVRLAGERVEDNLVYHNNIGFWPEEVGTFVVSRLTAVDNGTHTENRGAGNRAVYRDSTFASRITRKATTTDLIHFQYGSSVWLVNPTIVNHTGPLASYTDIAIPPQAGIWLQNPRFVNGRPEPSFGEEHIATYLDDALLPRGTYTMSAPHALPGSQRVQILQGDDWLPGFRMSVRPRYAELDVRNRAAVGTRLNLRQPIIRQDGLSYRDGMFGYTAIVTPTVTYHLPTVATGGYAMRLNFDFEDREEPVAGDPSVRVSFAVNAAPTSVHRTNDNRDRPGGPTTTNRLRLAASAADFAANPRTTYLYDAAAKRVTVTATLRWIVVVP